MFRAVIDMNEFVWTHFRKDLMGLTQEEVQWRPLPQANNINLIVRHLRIEAQWQLASLEHGEPQPAETTGSVRRLVDSIGFDFEENLKKLDELCTQFIAVLRNMNETDLEKQNQLAYREYPADLMLPPHFLSFHHASHLCQHWGQVRTIRTLYVKTRGEPVPAQFFPDNPSFPE
jgi:DinB superfamily